MSNEPPIDPSGQTPPGSTPPPGQTPPITPTGQTPPGQQKTSLDALPPDIQEYIKELRSQAAASRKQLDAEAKAKQAAEEQRLKEQGEYKLLAEQHAARLKELEPVAQSYTTLAQLVGSQIEAQIKEWPPTVKVFDPGPNAPIEDRLAWVEKSVPLIEQLQLQARGTQPGNSPNPRPVASTPDDARNEFTKKLRASGKYGA